jgi:ribosomal protein L29
MSEFSTKTQKELLKTLAEKKTALQSFRLGNSRSKTKNVKEGRTIRKDIAQIMTALKTAAK